MTVDLDRVALVALFDALAAKCEQRGVRAELFVVGGAAMALAYGTLKALAARESDEEDLLVLFRECGYASASEALEDVAAAYPARPLRPATTPSELPV